MLDPDRAPPDGAAVETVQDPAGSMTLAIRRPMLVTLIVASSLSPLAINIFIPSMASIASSLDASATSVGLGLSLYLAMVAVVQLAAGPLSDRFGRRPIILAGLALFLLGTALCMFAESITMFLLGRIVQAASATGLVLSRAVVRDIFPREKAASMIGYVTMGYAVAPMFGPAIGGFIDIWAGWRAVFWMLGGVGLMALALTAFDLSETNVNRGMPMRAQLGGYRALVRDRAFWLYTAAASLITATFFTFLGSAPFIAVETLKMTSADYGLWFMICSIGYIGGNFVVGRLSQKVGLRKLIVAGAVITTLGGSICVVSFALGLLAPLTLFGPLLLVGFGNGLAVPTATAGGLSVRPDAAGAAAGLLGALQIGAGAATSFVAASLSSSPLAVAALMALLGFAGLTVAVSIRPVRATT